MLHLPSRRRTRATLSLDERDAADRAALEIRRRAYLEAHGLPSEAARRLGYTVVTSEDLESPLRSVCNAGDTEILVSSRLVPPVRELVIAQALVKLTLPATYRQGPARFTMAQRAGAALLGPEEWFSPLIRLANFNLAAAKRWRPMISWEALGVRTADLFPNMTFTMWRPWGYSRTDDSEPSLIERSLVAHARKYGSAHMSGPGCFCAAWRADGGREGIFIPCLVVRPNCGACASPNCIAPEGKVDTQLTA